ncbi:TadE/TadG family type IV pilus assembly protein [Actinobacillus delphinicola]|uniref:Tight adherence protein G n=1 Tax=Actinobacillus delphinicola TaxID=51161 RepID=A0A448TVD9_9PAST|nr:hypothetical protein [Actinobacillus delphinicola]VEJ09898.1 tight adherence protein G [Actinobacillus delphinicola]
MDLLLGLKKKLNTFITQENGAYAIMMVLLTFFLIGFIAIIVDGTGWLQDKVRFTEGLEQAGLFITAEDDQFRKDKNHTELNAQNYNEQYKIAERNQALLRGITRTYYLPENAQRIANKDIFSPTLKTHDGKVLDRYHYDCKYSVEQSGINCKIGGYFERTSWLYYGKDYQRHIGLTFNTTEPVGNELDFAKPIENEEIKPQPKKMDLDVVVVVDGSASMYEPLNGDYHSPRCFEYFKSRIAFYKSTSLNPSICTSDDNEQRYLLGRNMFCTNCKVDLLDRALYQLSQVLLKDNTNNRLGITVFQNGAFERGTSKLVIPFIIQQKYFELIQKRIDDTYKSDPEDWYKIDPLNYPLGIDAAHYLDVEQTKDLIHRLDGSLITNICKTCDSYTQQLPYPSNNPATLYNKFWFNSNATDRDLLIKYINFQYPGYSTMSSAGIMVGANQMLYNFKHRSNKKNVQRIMIIMSDGTDTGLGVNITAQLFDNGFCKEIRKRLDRGMNTKTKMYFIQFGNYQYTQNKTLWKKCIGDNFITALKAQDLINAFETASQVSPRKGSPTQEVGYSKNLN